jgi:hypothetical protein
MMSYRHSEAMLVGAAAIVMFAAMPAFAGVPSPVPVAPQFGATATDPCTDSEEWTFRGALPDDAIREFSDALKGKLSFPRGFSEALAYRRLLSPADGGYFAEYWAGRMLYRAGLHHMAGLVFAAVLSHPVDKSNAGVQAAALGCLARIHEGFASVVLPDRSEEKLIELYPKTDFLPLNVRHGLWKVAGTLARNKIARGASDEEMAGLLKTLSGAGAEEKFTQGLHEYGHSRHKKAAAAFAAFFAMPTPKHLEKYLDFARLISGRANYSSGEYTKAAQDFNLVGKKSNELSAALVGLTWAYYQDQKYQDAVGAATSLRVGGMMHTFAPESPMVMAMALNEICQYPDALKAMDLFRRDYEQAYRWLSESNARDFYRLAIAYIKDDRKAGVPHKVAAEWIRSPLFLARQDEVNLIIEERGILGKVGKEAVAEYHKMTLELLKFARGIRVALKEARAKAKPGDPVPTKILDDLKVLQKKVVHLNRFRAAGPIWRAMMASTQKNVAVREKDLIAAINSDLKNLNLRMKHLIDDVMENTQLVEVEIFNGASQDIVWQNAHPDYKTVAADLDAKRKQEAAAKVWDWGNVAVSGDDGGEVWEDEVGAFKANIFDNCTSREKYLNIKKSERVERAKEMRKQLEKESQGN